MKRIGIIGSGRFGQALIESLVEKGAEVLLLDTSHEKVQNAADFVAKAVQGDATSARTLKEAGFGACDVVVQRSDTGLAELTAHFGEAERAALPLGDELLAFLRDYETCRFTRLEDLTAVDYKEYFEMVYHLFSLENMTWIVVKVKLEPAQPVVPSVTSVFHSAEFEEREVYDLMGIDFTGHPDLRRILLADDFVGHPLRKDYKQELPPVVPRIRKGGC